MSSKANVHFIDEMDSSEKASSVPVISEPQKVSSLWCVPSTEFVLYSRAFNPNFDRQESLTSNQSEAPSTSRLHYEQISKKSRHSSETIEMDDSVLLKSEKSRVSQLSRGSKCGTQSDRSVENLVLKKTNESINFSFSNLGPDITDNMQCAAERLRLGFDRKSSGEVTTRSDLFFSDNLLNEINADSQEDEFLSSENISQSYIDFQTYENTNVGRSNELITKTEEGKLLRELWRPKFSLNKSQIVAFFRKGKKSKKKTSGESKKKIPKRDFFQVRFLDPPVTLKEDYETKLFMRHLYFHILQLIFFTGIALHMVTSSMFYFTDITTKIFFDTAYGPDSDNRSEIETNTTHYPTLRNSRTIDDFWTYAENTLIKLLYWDFYYTKLDPSLITEKERKMFHDNQILGVARIRQVRVSPSSCRIYPSVRRYFNSCYGPYSVFREDVLPIKTNMDGSATATAWRYTQAGRLKSTFYWGEISVYGGGGYYLDLATTKDEARKMIQELKENQWVTRATRAIFIDFNIYNANVNLFCICKIAVELPPVGGIIPQASFHSLKLIRYLTGLDFFVLGCEFVYIIFVAFNTWKIIKAIKITEKWAFFFSFWNYLDVVIVLMSILYLILGIVRYVRAKSVTDDIADYPDNYTDFSVLKNIQIVFNSVIAIILFCSWVRLFSYFTFTKTMIQFNKTIRKSLRDMILFLPMFGTILSAFAILGFLLFGAQVKGFKSIMHSYMNLLQAFLGEFSYYELFEANRILGPVFYVLFVFFIFFVMLNMFIAIVNSAYVTVKSQVLPESSRTGEYLLRGLVNLFTCCQPRRRTKFLTRGIRRRILFDEIKKALKRAGFKDDEIQIFFLQYNINCSNFLDDKTRTRIMKDLELKKITFSETSEQFQINRLRHRLEEYRERMDSWEVKLQPVIDKVDILLHRS